jgi:hypothetical protein
MGNRIIVPSDRSRMIDQRIREAGELQGTGQLPSIVEDIKYIVDDLVDWDAIDDWELSIPVYETADSLYVIETFGPRSPGS